MIIVTQNTQRITKKRIILKIGCQVFKWIKEKIKSLNKLTILILSKFILKNLNFNF
jgi:hypothetical protein